MGIKDLDKFSRALRLRWLWHHWDHKDKPWKNLLKIIESTNRKLFFSSIVISIGDGMNTPFWEDGSMELLHENIPQIYTELPDSRQYMYTQNSLIITGLGTSITLPQPP
jgi:hypothetical protein